MTITMRAFWNAILTGELEIKNDETNTLDSESIFDDNGNLTETVRNFAAEQIKKIDDKNAARKTSNSAKAKAAEQEAFDNEVYTLMNEGTAYLANELAAGLTTAYNKVETAKVSASMRRLAAVGKVEVGETKVKGRKVKSYTKIVAD